MKVSELEGAFNSLSNTVKKIGTEVQALKDALETADGDIPEAAQTALDNLTQLLTQVDELNPDAPEPPPV